MFDAVILAAGNFPTHVIPYSLLDHERVVCCDSAAERFLQSGRTPWRCIGDGDSLDETLKERVNFIQVSEQEHNDLTKAVRLVRSELGGKARIAIIGATGRREDHTMGNIALLAEYLEMGLNVTMFTDHGVFLPCRGSHEFCAADFFAIHAIPLNGETKGHPSLLAHEVSLFNLSCTTLSSEGLRYAAYPFTRLWQGTLNEVVAPTFRITADGEYLVFLSYSRRKA